MFLKVTDNKFLTELAQIFGDFLGYFINSKK